MTVSPSSQPAEAPEPIMVHHLVDPETAIPSGNSNPPWQELIQLSWDDRQRVRQRVYTDRGTPVILALPRGTILKDGDLLFQNDQRQIWIRALPEPVLRIPSRSLIEIGRVVHQLGNWHRSAQILENGTVLAQADRPLQTWLEQKGISFELTESSFHPNLVGHGHDH